ncbi:right-handed parallel beta-helix repeat-containing protein [Candidatus Micrarchaeota archaeon]|nr:right-handed parallel beta-helix repeat-containing protein [Candidatus Micrarchaeota archaeon]
MKKIIFLFLILFSFAFAEGLDFSDVEGVDAPITTAIMDDVLDNCGTVIELNESTELEDDYTDTCFVINDEDITIDCEGNTIQGSGNDDGQVAFYANNMDGITIQNCKIKDIQYGIVLHDVDESTITDNDVENTEYAIYVGAPGQSSAKENTIEKNTIDEFLKAGIWLDEAKDSLINDNELEDGYLPIYLSDSEKSNIKNNKITEAEFVGIGVNNGEEIEVEKNTISKTGTGEEYGDGIALLNSENCIVSENGISEAYTSGIAVVADEDLSVKNELYENSINDAECGILFGMDNIFAYGEGIEECKYGLCFSDVGEDDLEGCVIENSSISDSDSEDVYVMTDDVKETNVLRNVGFNTGDVEFDEDADNSRLTIQEFIKIRILDKDEEPVEDAEVTFENGNEEEIMDDAETDENGETELCITTIGYYYMEDEDVDYEDYKEHEYSIKYGAKTFTGNFDVDGSNIYILELDFTMHPKGQVGDACSQASDCETGYCCGRGPNAGTCRASSSFCPDYECEENSDCDDDEVCENYECVELTGECGYVENHTWMEYACCEDADCKNNEKCEDHACVEINGTCGYVENHTWIEYACCVDEDCEEGYKCMGHECIGEIECQTNSDCEENEFCENNKCIEIVPATCGHIHEHKWYDYECCADSDCEAGKVCKNNMCIKEEEEEEKQARGCAPALVMLFVLGCLFVSNQR